MCSCDLIDMGEDRVLVRSTGHGAVLMHKPISRFIIRDIVLFPFLLFVLGLVLGPARKKVLGLVLSSARKRKMIPLEEVTNEDRSILDLKVARDKLKRYQKQLEMEIDKLTKQAQQLVRQGRKDRALMRLEIKRDKQQQVAKSGTHLFSILQLINAFDSRTPNNEVIHALREGNVAPNALHAEMVLQEVEKLMEDSQEAVAYESDVARVLGGDLAVEYEQDILEEYEALQTELALTVQEPQGV